MRYLYFPLALALFAACTDYDAGYDAKTIAYQTAFRQAFGDVDPDQDFSLAQRYSVTVTPGMSHTISIYSNAQGNWQLVGQYSHVAGTTELGFDAVRSAQQFLVTDGLRTALVPAGGSVDFSGSTRATGLNVTSDTEQLVASDPYASGRTVSNWLNQGIDIDETIGGYTYFYYNSSTLTGDESVLAKMPAIDQPATDAHRGNLEQVDVIYDFSYVSTGTFIVYPVYWRTTRINTVGIYYQDPQNPNEVLRIPLLGNARYNESVQYTTSTDVPFWYTCRQTSADGLLADYSAAANDTDHQLLRSKGIVVDIPVGTQFGFYMLTDEGYAQYTEASRNNDVKWSEKDVEKACYFANFITRGLHWLCMEDDHDLSTQSGGEHSDFDFDDLVCLMGGNVPNVIENQSPGWLLAFEDLGDTFDWDFNDVLLQFNYVSGSDQARIIPLAAGGTLPSVIHFSDGSEGDDQTVGEIHCLLNPELTEADLYEPINADSRGKQGETQVVSICNPDFSITQANQGMSSNSPTLAQNAVGITIEVNNQQETNYVAYQGAGHAPEVLILPKRYTLTEGTTTYAYTWAWPLEMKRIYQSYAEEDHTFSAWITDHTQAQDWYKYPTKEVVEEQRVVVSSSGDPSTDPSAAEGHIREYDWAVSTHGTPVAIPEPDPSHNYLYRFDATELFQANKPAQLYLVARGGLVVSDGSDQSSVPYGIWTSPNWMGNTKYSASSFIAMSQTMINRLKTYNPDLEVMCRITLTADEVNHFRENSNSQLSTDHGQLMIWAGQQLVALSVLQ